MRTRRHLILAGALWAALTAVTYLWVFTTDLQPLGAADQAEIIDEAFEFLILLSVPVFAFVVALLAYTMLAFRSNQTDAPGRNAKSRVLITVWIVLSTILTVTVIIHPGFTGLAKLNAEEPADLTIVVTAHQWNWDVRYGESDVEFERADELILPVNQRVHFVITADDVIHSFWVPAFRMKMDAVPGRVTHLWVTPNLLGTSSLEPTTFDDSGLLKDEGFRVQCAELCGTGHNRMRLPIAVVEAQDFETWLVNAEAAYLAEEAANADS